MGGIAWTEEEDHLLKKCIEQYGEGKWHRVPQLAGLNRCRKSCRLRWLNYLRPNIRRGSFSQDEMELIIKLHKRLGNRWSFIAARLPGRTANDVKNYWNCHLSKKLNAPAWDGEFDPMDHVDPDHGPPLQLINQQTYHQMTLAVAPTHEESCSTSTTMLSMEDDGVQDQDTNVLDDHVQHKYSAADGDLPMNLDVVEQQVKAMPTSMQAGNSFSNWDWDDFISEVDLWNESLQNGSYR